MFTAPANVIEQVRLGFAAGKVVVVGDLMLDRYLWGQVERISPEAPVPVVRLERETQTAGGAANVARNLAALGLSVRLAGVTGADSGREMLLRDLDASGVDAAAVLVAEDRVTTVKTRVVGNHQQMIRIDSEHAVELTPTNEERLVAAVCPLMPEADALVLSDYAKGVLTEQVCQRLIKAANQAQVPVLIDPKGADFSRYAGATLITPNRSELSRATGVTPTDPDALLAAAANLRDTLGLRMLVLTMSEQGMVLVEPGATRQIPALAREVFDVSGAGDTVIATFAAGLAVRMNPIDTAHLANLAAGVVVGKVGTATVSAKELLAAMADESALEQAAKICEPMEALAQVRRWQADSERVVFTNGCFDLLHVGHVTYLERARRHGHRLVVGLNTDRSVAALKGPDRPLIGEADRARVLAALASVDAVILFDEDTPLALIKKLRPDVLAKGADYRMEDVVGAQEVKSWGGQVVLVPLVENRSSSGIIRRMNASGIGPPTD